MNLLKKAIKIPLNYLGFDITRYTPNSVNPLLDIFELYKVDTVFDIGANTGMSAKGLRNIGYQGLIVSFEPVTRLYSELEKQADQDPLWIPVNCALGDSNTKMKINVSGGHGGASSILEMTDNVKINAPDQQVIMTEEIEVRTLDWAIEKYYPNGDTLFLKIDVQGYEKRVLDGAKDSLDKVIGLKIEMSLIENYVGEMLWNEMSELLYKLGFRLTLINRAWFNKKTQEIYQVDGIFFRVNKLNLI